jgi:two-component system, cell cycle sensor histidine kinase and response regulator CckA
MNRETRWNLGIVALYATLGTIWFGPWQGMFSDEHINRGGSGSGFLYVALSSLLLFALLRRFIRKERAGREALQKEIRTLERERAGLAKSAARYRALFDGHSAMLYLIDRETFVIREANEAARQFYGYQAAQLEQLTLADLSIQPAAALKLCTERATATTDGYFTDQHRLADGSVRTVAVHATPIQLADHSCYFAIVHDITDRMRTEEALRQSEEALRESEIRYRSLVETTSDWIWEIDANEQYTYASPKIRDFLGYDPHEVIGKTPFDLMPEEEALRVRQLFNYSKDQGKPFFGLENRNRHKNGKLIMLESSGVPLLDQHGNVIGFRGIDRNVTDRKHLEEQLTQSQKMEAVGQLAGGIAHDFNNILTAMTGYLYILDIKLQDESLKKHVEQIRLAAERAAGLIEGLLTFSRKQIICLKPVQINTIIRRTEQFLSRLIREDIEIRMHLGGDDLVILGDETKVEQVLINLVTNARDAMPNGGILSINTERCPFNGEQQSSTQSSDVRGYILLSVADSGTGIDEATREKLFEPFFTTKEVGKGTGLGLAIVYGVIKQLNGYIDILSEPGIGTTVNVYLPLVEKVSEESAYLQHAVPRGGAETLLVAEDDPDVRRFIKTVLEEFGYTIIEAVDGRDAVENFLKHRETIHGVILDIIMPKMNGRDAHREMIRIQPDLKALFLSGYTGEVLTQEGILEEGLNFLPKPVVPWRLLDKVQQILSGNGQKHP